MHCIEALWSGGVEQMKLVEAKGLDRNRYEQAIICTKATGALPQRFADAGCTVHEIGEFRRIDDAERYRNAFRFVKEFRPHIIHGAVFEGVAIAALVGRAAGVPVIIGEEITEPRNRRWRGHLLFRALASLTHHMVAVSPQVEDYLVGRLKLPQKKVTLINNGIYEPQPASQEQKLVVRDRHGIQPEDFIVGCCCRLSEIDKRVSDLIKAFAMVCSERPNAKLLLVGDGPDAEGLRELAISLGIAEKVLFPGYIGDTRPYFEIMDVFALASAFEGLPVALLEAMYAGIPVVATEVGGIPTAVVDQVTGFLVAPNAPAELASKIARLADDAGLRNAMGEAALARAKSDFSAERCVSQFDRLYQRLVRSRLTQ
jgi:glycosyltransferase involved in cell wall biosynthesis